MGISVLGVVEIFYIFTIRLFWHISGRKVDTIKSHKDNDVELENINPKFNKDIEKPSMHANQSTHI